MEHPRTYNRDGAHRFPLMPGTQATAWRYIFDWTIAAQMLHCSTGDRVLDFASGPCFASELLNRLGYSTVSFDIESAVLSFARERFAMDQRLYPQHADFVVGDGLHLPFGDASFDGIICLNAFHHMPDYAAALAEMCRVLRPGCRAVFSEPGAHHASSAEARVAREQYGATEKNIVLAEIAEISKSVGFATMQLQPFVYPGLVELDYGQLEAYANASLEIPYTRPGQIAAFIKNSHSIFALSRPGARPPTSTHPSILRAQITPVRDITAPMWLDSPTEMAFAIRNTGDTLWLAQPREFGGHVTLGIKLCRNDGRLICDTLGRTLLRHDVHPDEQITVNARFSLPGDLEPGDYKLNVDMVLERVAWFEHLGSRPLVLAIKVGKDHKTRPTQDPQLLQDAVPANAPQTRIARSKAATDTNHTRLITQAAGAALAELGAASSKAMLRPIAQAIGDLAG